jgi:hypothetical protein
MTTVIVSSRARVERTATLSVQSALGTAAQITLSQPCNRTRSNEALYADLARITLSQATFFAPLCTSALDKTYPRPTSSNLIQSKGTRSTTLQNKSVKPPVESLKAPALKQARASYRAGSRRFQAKLSRITFNHLLTQSHHMHLIRTIGLTTPASVTKGFGHRIIGR